MVVTAPARYAIEHLLVLTLAGVEGYRHAAAAVSDPLARAFLVDCAARREECVSALKHLLSSLGSEPESQGSIPAAIHRGWVDVLAAMRAHAVEPVLRECERGDAEALAAFRRVFAFDLPRPVAEVLLQQLRNVRDVAQRVRKFRESLPETAPV